MNEKEKIIEDLKKKISKGNAIKGMMKTKGFTEVFIPWFEKTLYNYEKNGLVNVNKMSNEEMRVWGGEYRGVMIVKNFFTRAVKEADKANEKLRELEKNV